MLVMFGVYCYDLTSFVTYALFAKSDVCKVVLTFELPVNSYINFIAWLKIKQRCYPQVGFVLMQIVCGGMLLKHFI